MGKQAIDPLDTQVRKAEEAFHQIGLEGAKLPSHLRALVEEKGHQVLLRAYETLRRVRNGEADRFITRHFPGRD